MATTLGGSFTEDQILMIGKLREMNQKKLTEMIHHQEKLGIFNNDGKLEGVILSRETFAEVIKVMEKVLADADYRWAMKEFGDRFNEPNPQYEKKPEGMTTTDYLKKMTQE